MRHAFAILLLTTIATPALANKVYVSNEKGNDVTVIDGDTLEVLGHYPVGNRPRGRVVQRTLQTLERRHCRGPPVLPRYHQKWHSTTTTTSRIPLIADVPSPT